MGARTVAGVPAGPRGSCRACPPRWPPGRRLGDDLDGSNGVVVAGDDVLDEVRVRVGVREGHHRDTEPVGLGDGDGLARGVDDHDGTGRLAHLLDAAEVALELAATPLQHEDLFLGELLVGAVLGLLLDVSKLVHRLSHGLPVGEHAAQPTRHHVELSRAARLLDEHVLGLLLRPHEEDRLALGGRVADEVRGPAQQHDGLLEVDDVDAVARAEDVLLHARVPTLGAVPEVDAALEKLADADVGGDFFVHGRVRARGLLLAHAVLWR